jgi:hypothetical protein
MKNRVGLGPAGRLTSGRNCLPSNPLRKRRPLRTKLRPSRLEAVPKGDPGQNCPPKIRSGTGGSEKSHLTSGLRLLSNPLIPQEASCGAANLGRSRLSGGQAG